MKHLVAEAKEVGERANEQLLNPTLWRFECMVRGTHGWSRWLKAARASVQTIQRRIEKVQWDSMKLLIKCDKWQDAKMQSCECFWIDLSVAAPARSIWGGWWAACPTIPRRRSEDSAYSDKNKHYTPRNQSGRCLSPSRNVTYLQPLILEMLCSCLRVQRVLEKFWRQEVLFCQENAVPLDSPEADFIKWDCCGSNWGGLLATGGSPEPWEGGWKPWQSPGITGVFCWVSWLLEPSQAQEKISTYKNSMERLKVAACMKIRGT